MTAGIRLSVTRSMDVMALQSPLELLHLWVACTLLTAAIMLITINQILSAILNLLFFFFFLSHPYGEATSDCMSKLNGPGE